MSMSKWHFFSLGRLVKNKQVTQLPKEMQRDVCSFLERKEFSLLKNPLETIIYFPLDLVGFRYEA